MALLNNILAHIQLPAGIRLSDGRTLYQPCVFDVIGNLDPYYAGVDMVRLQGGMYLRKLKDMSVALAIYQASQEAKCLCPLVDPAPDTPNGMRFWIARQQWVTAKAALSLVTSVGAVLGYPGGHVLGNFSATRQVGLMGEGVGGKLQELRDTIKKYEITLTSRGDVLPGGHVRPRMAAKDRWDGDPSPGRTWYTTGMGANEKGWDWGSPTGGRGKPAKYRFPVQMSVPVMQLHPGSSLWLGTSIGGASALYLPRG